MILKQQQELDELKDLVGDNWRDNMRNGSLFSFEENSDKKIKVWHKFLNPSLHKMWSLFVF